MVDIKGNHTIVTDNEGNSILDLSNADEGKYNGVFTFNGDLNYADSTSSKVFSIYEGLTTRLLVNGKDITSLTGKFYDNTSMKISLQYENNNVWVTKQVYSLDVDIVETGDKITLTNINNVLDLSKYDADTYTVNISFPGSLGYLPVSKTVTYTQNKNDVTITNTEDLVVYGDEDVQINPIIKTPEGNPVVNKVLSMDKQGTTYTSVTDIKGAGSFSSRLNYALSTDFTDDCSVDNSSNFTGGTVTWDKDHYNTTNNVTLNNLTTLDGKRLDLKVKDGTLVIHTANSDNTLIWVYDTYIQLINNNFYRQFSKKSDSILSLALHNNVLKIYVDDKILFALKLNNPYSKFVFNYVKIYNIKISSLPDSTTLASETVTFTSLADNNLNGATITNTITVNEYKTFNLPYLIDGYDTDKLMTINSVLSFDKSDLTDYGVSYVKQHNGNFVDENKVNVFDLNNHYASNETLLGLQATFYGKQVDTAYTFVTPTNLASVEDWNIYEKDGYSGVNIVLESDKETIAINGSFTLTARLGVKGKKLNFYENKVLKGTATTDSNGVCTFPITNSKSGTYTYQVNYDGDSVYPSINSNKVTVTASLESTSLSLTANKTTAPLGSVVTLNVNLGVYVSGLNVKFYEDGNLLSTGTTNSGGNATYNITLNNYGSKTYNVLFEGTSKYKGGSSNSLTITTTKISTSLSANINKSNVQIDETFTITATLSPVLSGVTINMYDKVTNNLISSATTNSSGVATIDYSESNVVSGYYELTFTENSTYYGSKTQVLKPTVVVSTTKDTVINITSGTDYYNGWELRGSLKDKNGNSLGGQQLNVVILYDYANNSGISTVTTDTNGNWRVPLDVSNTSYFDKNLNAYVYFNGYDVYNKSELYKTIQYHGSTTVTGTITNVYNFNSSSSYRDWTLLSPENVNTSNDGKALRCGVSCTDSYITPISEGFYMPNKLAVISNINIPSTVKITNIRVVYTDMISACNGNYITIENSDVGVYNSSKQELGHNSSSSPGRGVYATHTYDMSGSFDATSQLNLLITYAGNPTKYKGLMYMDYIKLYATYAPVQGG